MARQMDLSGLEPWRLGKKPCLLVKPGFDHDQPEICCARQLLAYGAADVGVLDQVSVRLDRVVEFKDCLPKLWGLPTAPMYLQEVEVGASRAHTVPTE